MLKKIIKTGKIKWARWYNILNGSSLFYYDLQNL